MKRGFRPEDVDPEIPSDVLEKSAQEGRIQAVGRIRMIRDPHHAALVRARNQKHTGSESIVQQHLADETDINVIVRRFGHTGVLPEGHLEPVYGDFTGVSDYHSAVERVERAVSSFMALSPEIRERFHNDPGEFLEFAEQRPYEDVARELGLHPAPVAPVAAAAVEAAVAKNPNPDSPPPSPAPSTPAAS